VTIRLPPRALLLLATWTALAPALSGCRPSGSGPSQQPASPSASSSSSPAPGMTPATAPAVAAAATLTVKVTGLRSRKGQLIFGVFKTAEGFPTEESRSVNWQVKDADADTVTFTASLPPGVYGASVLHDENRNGKMDKNLAGIPLEGYGVTNNPRPALRAATFKESTFTLPPAGATLTISVQYFY
jgi:uncharacterized protein (DUF2141 family)